MIEDEDEGPASRWLSAWVDEHINSPGYDEDKANFEVQAQVCLAHAEAEGFSKSDIMDAAGGDLAAFLMDSQNALTDAEVQRLSREDD
ncbi:MULTISPECIES: hypothetical protein [Mesorhizobium]|uniref:DUF768 domain-containing protein n=1 Tax=Mesorhizobium temperatum TaxID=241416 RepID=A0A271LU68_9HYPH|nr:MULTISPECIES: hypothetical protein [Mesorhizobium]PAQ11721.1 hypothetical protein CIT26_03390 [Mesorhizobium temperatum]TIQ18746.1 MAG: hypothetical protein E5X51_24465 [Mesorhizobium sp.]